MSRRFCHNRNYDPCIHLEIFAGGFQGWCRHEKVDDVLYDSICHTLCNGKYREIKKGSDNDVKGKKDNN